MKRRVVILGITGSIGRQACDIVAHHPEEFEIVGAVCGADAKGLESAKQIFSIREIATLEPNKEDIPFGQDAVNAVAAMESDIVLVAIPGIAALAPALAAIEAGRDIALASKEVLVAAGELVTRRRTETGSKLFPVDSEHSALWQCLRGEHPHTVARVILTASGGPFRTWAKTEMAAATPDQALAHPNWDMGNKVTIDSATMMNKGLEIIEAHHLFGFPYNRIDVVIHPSSSVHSMVEFVDGVTLAQIGIPDMRPPIALALTGGKRLHTVAPALDMVAPRELVFEAIDDEKFPAVSLARKCGERGGLVPTAMNAANEVAVAEFLKGSIRFGDIVETVATVSQEADESLVVTLESITMTDQWARWKATELLEKVAQT